VNEIVIYDANSTDRTVSIIKKYKNISIIYGPNHSIFHFNKQTAIAACKSDWILQLDADEVVTSKLKTEILSILQNPSVSENGFWINRKNYFLGKFLTKGGIYPDSTIRLYKNGKGRLPCKNVHEQAQVDGDVGFLKNDLDHFADPTFSRYLLRNDRYTSLIADELSKQGVSFNFLNFMNFFLIKPIHWFLLAYILHRGYVDGFPGFVFAWYSSLRFPISYIKHYEKNRH
jgi:glycosyltransferase involved in cell wall biosynthesis